MSAQVLTREAFKLKARLYTFAIMELFDANIQAFTIAMQNVYKKAPNMFASTPIVLDVSHLKGVSFDLKGICEVMREYKLIPVAIQGTSVIQRKAASAYGLAVIASSQHKEASAFEGLSVDDYSQDTDISKAKHSPEEKQEQIVDSAVAPVSSQMSKVITAPVRSGQQIYAKGGDLIVLASVGQGAELLADGHIHVYGRLRGRALAGINGNERARIFCHELDAELLSIAGCYITPDKDKCTVKGCVQIYLDDGRLQIKSL